MTQQRVQPSRKSAARTDPKPAAQKAVVVWVEDALQQAPAVHTLIKGLKAKFHRVIMQTQASMAMAALMQQRSGALVLVQKEAGGVDESLVAAAETHARHMVCWRYRLNHEGSEGQLEPIRGAASSPFEATGDYAPIPMRPANDEQTATTESRNTDPAQQRLKSLALPLPDAGSPLDGPLISEEEMALLIGGMELEDPS